MIEDQHDKGGENGWRKRTGKKKRKKNGDFPRIILHSYLFTSTFSELFLLS